MKENLQTTILRKFKFIEKEDHSPTKSYTLGYFNAIKPEGEILHFLDSVKKDRFIEIEKESGKSLGTYGFTELNYTGAFSDCPNIGYLVSAAMDNVIFRSRPFMTMAASYELRKKQVEIFTELLKLKIDDECNPTDPNWLATHDIYITGLRNCVLNLSKSG